MCLRQHVDCDHTVGLCRATVMMMLKLKMDAFIMRNNPSQVCSRNPMSLTTVNHSRMDLFQQLKNPEQYITTMYSRRACSALV